MISKSYPSESAAHPNRVHLRPRMEELLQSLRLDVTYERGSGDHLFYRDEAGEEVEILDLVGGFGSLLFGHNHPVLIAEAQRLFVTRRPVHSQGSHREYAQRLAAALSGRAGGGHSVLFGNSGSEAVEIAIKHILFQSEARTIITLEGAFHGKTLGALQLTSNPYFREGFELGGLRILRVRANDHESLEAAFAAAGSDAAAFIFEPVLGEGGVLPLTANYVQRAAELCSDYSAVLVADECQTGMGRTGRFLASESLGVEPDYIILSKALGGGLVKISACLIKEDRYRNEFDLRHTSTFADDDFSSAIALKTLEMLDPETLGGIRQRGDDIVCQIEEIKASYPDVLQEVRGAGLMIGIEFRPVDQSESFLLRFLTSQGDLVKLLTGYFLHVHRVRVLPLLSSPFTLRLQPSALVTNGDIAHFIIALRDVCARLHANDIVGLTEFCRQASAIPPQPRIPREIPRFFSYRHEEVRPLEKNTPTRRAAWLCHLVDTDDLASIDPAFEKIPASERELLLRSWANHASPVLMSSSDVRSPAGGEVRFHTIMLPITSASIKKCLEERDLHLPRTLVQQGIELARQLGCQVASLGQYTSIVTANGRRLDGGGMGITSGNSYAVALAIEAVHRAMAGRGIDPVDTTLAIVGAAGNIGQTCASLLGPAFARTLLVGPNSPGSHRRLQKLADGLPGTNAICFTNLAAIRQATVIVSASNAALPTLHSSHLCKGAIVCDISVPASVHPDALRDRPDLLVIKGGVAQLPFGEDLDIAGFPLPRGQVFACMAEGILLGMEGVSNTNFTGALSPAGVNSISRFADRHEFRLAEYKTECVLGSTHAPDFVIPTA